MGRGEFQFADGTVWNLSNITDAASAFTWTGSSTNPTLAGNDYGSNTFQLGEGAETANGGARGNAFQVSTSTGQAALNLSSAAGSRNEIDFSTGISDGKLWFEQSGNDLKIDLMGSTSSVTVKNWFSGSSIQLQEITARGLKIDGQISQLVQAMASYSASHSGFDPTSLGAVPQDPVSRRQLARLGMLELNQVLPLVGRAEDSLAQDVEEASLNGEVSPVIPSIRLRRRSFEAVFYFRRAG